jgi:ABC-2 type transport system ATP-binding protein
VSQATPEAVAADLQAGVRLRALRKHFGRRRALDGVDLELSGPQIVGVAGPDGAGKTTLLRCLAGLLEVQAEEASVLGHELRRDVRALKQRVGYVPQSFSLHRELSVGENLAFTARLHRLAPEVFQARADELLERTGLAPFRARPAGALSGGMKQKLAIANALLPAPALLVLDEPTAGVDVMARAEIWELLAQRRASTLVLISTSYLDEAGRCDRLVYLDSGRVVASGTPAELRAGVSLELYRAWGQEPRALARAARGLPYVLGARASGRFARVEVSRARSPGESVVLHDLSSLPGVGLAESLPLDMESTLLALARRDASSRAA